MKRILSLLPVLVFVLSCSLMAQSPLRHSQHIRDFFEQSSFVKLNVTAGLSKNINIAYELGFANRLSAEIGGAYLIPTRYPNTFLNNELKLDLNGKDLIPFQTSNFKGYSGFGGLNFYLSSSSGFDNEGWYVGAFGKYMNYQFDVATKDADNEFVRLNKAKVSLWMPGFQIGYKFVFNSGIFTDSFLGLGQSFGNIDYTIQGSDKIKTVSVSRPLPRAGIRLGYKF